jgi:hypothetical protein
MIDDVKTCLNKDSRQNLEKLWRRSIAVMGHCAFFMNICICPVYQRDRYVEFPHMNSEIVASKNQQHFFADTGGNQTSLTVSSRAIKGGYGHLILNHCTILGLLICAVKIMNTVFIIIRMLMIAYWCWGAILCMFWKRRCRVVRSAHFCYIMIMLQPIRPRIPDLSCHWWTLSVCHMPSTRRTKPQMDYAVFPEVALSWTLHSVFCVS